MSEKYATLEILAQHGKTSVVKAKHLVTGRVVALKKTSPENRETLRKEAQSLGKLKHPNIAEIYDAEIDSAEPYIAIEYADTTLRSQINGKMHFAKAIPLLEQVLCALEYAHNQGIVHGDLKPENILLKDDQVKIIDFGIAKNLEGRLSHTNQTPDTTPKGTYRYSAPEQFDQGIQTPASDLYSVGVILYELLTGKRPGITAPKPSSVSDAPPEIDNIFYKLVEEEPARRYQTAKELKNTLVQIREMQKQNTAVKASEMEENKTLKEQLEKEKAQQYRAFAYAAAIGVAGITTLLALGPCSHTKPIEQSDVSEVRIALPYQHTDFQSDRAIYYRVNDNNSLELAKRIDELFKHRQAVALRNGKLPPGKSHYSSKQVEQLFAEIAGQDGNPVDISRIDYDKTVKSWKDELK